MALAQLVNIPYDILQEAEIQLLYKKLYPLMMRDFRHVDDCSAAMRGIGGGHNGIVTSGAGSPGTVRIPPIPVTDVNARAALGRYKTQEKAGEIAIRGLALGSNVIDAESDESPLDAS